MQRGGTTPPAKKPGRASLPLIVAPPKGSPFAGISGTHAPAKNTAIPHLTEHVQIARDKVQALQHAGLHTEAEREATTQAQAILAKSKPLPKPFVPKSGGKPASRPPDKLPARLSQPAVSLATRPSAPTPTAPSRLPTGSRGAPNLGPRAGMAAAEAAKPKGQLLEPLKEFAGRKLSDPLGTELQLLAPAVPQPKGTNLTANVAKQGNQLAAKVQGAGLSLPDKIPSADLVPEAGAASQTEYTPQALVAAGLSEKQTKLFRTKALKQGWYGQEIDGLVGLDLIKHAYSKPPPMALRVLQNFGGGVIRQAALPNVGVALGKEFTSGHGMRAAKELGDATVGQFGAMAQHPGQALVSDPYAFVPTAGAVAKTVGGIGGKVLEKAGREAAERTVTHAVTGEVIPRGPQARNLYTASGQLANDFLTGKSAHLSRKVDAQRVDKLVSDVNNESAPLHHGVQTDYAKAFKGVGEKRATVLAGVSKAGGKPEKILAKYTADGNKRQVKYWTQVVEASKNLSAKDRAFIAAHKAVGAQTTGTHVELGRFSDTAGIYRSHQPLILSDAHAGDPMAQRVQALHDEWVTTLRKTDDPAVLDPMFGAYDHAVREYADTHLAAGGEVPTRVAYTKPPATGVTQPLYRTGTGGRARFNARVPKQKASTGGSFESGDYLIDPKTAIRENLQAQRLRTSVGLTSDESLAKIGAVKAERGDARPEGYTFTPAQNPATVGKVITDLNDAPVGAHDYYHQESSVRDRYAKHLEHTADSTGEFASEKGWFVPDGSWKRILDYTRPESRNAYDQFMRQYQRAMISIYPSTLLGNTLGSVPLALAAGAGPKSFAKAAESSSLGGDITLVPHSLHGRGVAGNLAADARNPLSQGMNKMRRGNVVGEDFSRDAAYFAKALRGAKKRSKELGYDDVNAYLRDMATGKVDPHIRDQAIAHAIKFAGDAAKPSTKIAGKWAGRVILFPQWLQHMTKLMLFTLPVKHPRRMALINALATYGDQYRKEHGALPSWMQEFAPLLTHTMGGQAFTTVAGLGQLAPQGSAGSPFDTLLNSNQPITDRIASLANPPVAAALKIGLQAHDNPKAAYPVDMQRFILNQLLYTAPGMSKFFPRTGMEDDSLPWSPRRYTIPYKDPDGNSVQVPWAMRSGARPVDGPLGIASRIFGLPLYDVPTADSAINKRQVGTAIYKAKHPPKKRG